MDKINPEHYKSSSGLQVIDVIEAFTEGMSGMEAVCTANAIKYICRWKKKNGTEDLKKAEWYIDRLIREISAKEYQNIKSENNSEYTRENNEKGLVWG